MDRWRRQFCRDREKLCRNILLVEIKVKLCHSAQTATDINVEKTQFFKEISNLAKNYQLLVIPEHLLSFQRRLRFWH